MAINRYNMDMCSGPLLGKMIRYAIPLAITYILQLTFHAADLMIIGNFGSFESMASIGTTSDLINLTVNMLVGISIGANVLAAQYYGAKARKDLSRTIHTSMFFAIVGGAVIGLLGILLCHPALQMIKVPESVLPKSASILSIKSIVQSGISFLISPLRRKLVSSTIRFLNASASSQRSK